MVTPAQAQAHHKALMRLNQDLTNRQLAMILRDAAEEGADLAGRIGAMQGVGPSTRARQLRIASQGAQQISSNLWNVADKQIRSGIFDSVDLAINHAIDVDFFAGMPVETILGYTEGLQASVGRTAEAIIARRRHGYTLSERVYRNTALARGRIHGVIDRGLAQQLSARELAGNVRTLISPNTPGGVSYSAMRLARTEINNSYHFAFRDRTKSRPWVEKVDWKLSGSHGAPDACDDLVDEGPYDPNFVPDKPHPHCLCYTEARTPDPDEFSDNLVNGDYDPWLEDQGLDPIAAKTAARGPSRDLRRVAARERNSGKPWRDISIS